MPTAQEVPGIVAQVRQRLAAQPRAPLQVSGEKLDDDWLYIVVTPTQPGVRASDHAQVMTQIERELRQAGTEQVLLVPAVDD